MAGRQPRRWQIRSPRPLADCLATLHRRQFVLAGIDHHGLGLFGGLQLQLGEQGLEGGVFFGLICFADDGLEAISVCRKNKYDLILMDLSMPNMDGFEACRELKKNPELVDVPVIFMTGLSDSEHVVKGLESGGIDYVNKPINLDELLARIKVHLNNSRQAT